MWVGGLLAACMLCLPAQLLLRGTQHACTAPACLPAAYLPPAYLPACLLPVCLPACLPAYPPAPTHWWRHAGLQSSSAMCLQGWRPCWQPAALRSCAWSSLWRVEPSLMSW